MTLEQLAVAAKAWMQQMMAEAQEYEEQSQGVDQMVSGNTAVLRAEAFARGLAVQKMREFLTQCGLMDAGAVEREASVEAQRKSRMEHLNAVKQGKEPPIREVVQDDRLFGELQQLWATQFAGSYDRSMAQNEKAQKFRSPNPILDSGGEPIEMPVMTEKSDVDQLREEVAKLSSLLSQALGGRLT